MIHVTVSKVVKVELKVPGAQAHGVELVYWIHVSITLMNSPALEQSP